MKNKIIHLKYNRLFCWMLVALAIFNMYLFWDISKLLVGAFAYGAVYWSYLAITFKKNKDKDRTLFYYERFDN